MRTRYCSSASRIVSCLFMLIVIAGCASTKVTERQIIDPQRKLPRPDRILVYDFAATPADVPADSALAGHPDVQQTPQTAEQIETGRQVGAEIAAKLVEEIHSLGLPAERASTQTTPQINDIVIRGYLLSVEEGSRAKRMAIGFGAGKSRLSVAAEGYQMTAQGLRKLGSGTMEAGGGKGPGGAAPLAVVLATGNPVGLIVGGGIKAYGEMSGKSKIEGRAKDAAKAIVEAMKPRLRQQGWIE
ncbi:MAG: DUF4410 domain-containing protein [bacterium]|uniref:DUF4410 domain-containing protein n=1 Tax=Candidatus Methylomirabilis tolerans TaxID=3123416 RepID=A0AAJ1EIT9_9BACT|nr:DUF4410 domain-containing protein [Candidatus Methylomirabilis sp.]